MLMATNGRKMLEDDQKQYIHEMRKAAGIKTKQEEQRFSREKMDELRAFTDKYMR
ncbi:hypothetical protein [Paenibacillus larvae]|uniref:hypothetical protein n=1 Tax=Paenibacillus larvae TaxID=1464 RepID=UPI00131489D2|nr:hypothetical protein [Paenibacillus larvae]